MQREGEKEREKRSAAEAANRQIEPIKSEPT